MCCLIVPNRVSRAGSEYWSLPDYGWMVNVEEWVLAPGLERFLIPGLTWSLDRFSLLLV